MTVSSLQTKTKYLITYFRAISIITKKKLTSRQKLLKTILAQPKAFGQHVACDTVLCSPRRYL